SAATSSTDRSPCASRSTISARRPLDSALPTEASASKSASLAAREPTKATYGWPAALSSNHLNIRERRLDAALAHGPPGLPGDAQDDRRDRQADHRVRHRQTDRDDRRGR